jgi:hypothetical protein
VSEQEIDKYGLLAGQFTPRRAKPIALNYQIQYSNRPAFQENTGRKKHCKTMLKPAKKCRIYNSPMCKLNQF